MSASALGKGGSTRRWRTLRLWVLRRDDYRCWWCGREADTVDHVIRRADGGTDDPGNLVAACSKCNYSRGTRGRRDTPPSRNW